MPTTLKREMWMLGIEIIDNLANGDSRGGTYENAVKLTFKQKLAIHRIIKEYTLEVFKPLILKGDIKCLQKK